MAAIEIMELANSFGSMAGTCALDQEAVLAVMQHHHLRTRQNGLAFWVDCKEWQLLKLWS